MGYASQLVHKEAVLRMKCGETSSWMLLQIWDGRYAAFWKAGFDGGHCIAAAKHQINDDGWPFAFVSEDKQAVIDFINASERSIRKEIPLKNM